tara:strand:- start:10280 stop:10570 length:291 start_codon:yes stop_codon:yes gene_type:complete
MSRRALIKISKPIVIIKRNSKHYTNATKEDFNNNIEHLSGKKPNKQELYCKGNRSQLTENQIELNNISILLENGITKIPDQYFKTSSKLEKRIIVK